MQALGLYGNARICLSLGVYFGAFHSEVGRCSPLPLPPPTPPLNSHRAVNTVSLTLPLPLRTLPVCAAVQFTLPGFPHTVDDDVTHMLPARVHRVTHSYPAGASATRVDALRCVPPPSGRIACLRVLSSSPPRTRTPECICSLPASTHVHPSSAAGQAPPPCNWTDVLLHLTRVRPGAARVVRRGRGDDGAVAAAGFGPKSPTPRKGVSRAVSLSLPPQLQAGSPFLWMNPRADDERSESDTAGAARVSTALAQLPLQRRHLEEARATWQRLAPLLQRAFPEAIGESTASLQQLQRVAVLPASTGVGLVERRRRVVVRESDVRAQPSAARLRGHRPLFTSLRKPQAVPSLSNPNRSLALRALQSRPVAHMWVLPSAAPHRAGWSAESGWATVCRRAGGVATHRAGVHRAIVLHGVQHAAAQLPQAGQRAAHLRQHQGARRGV
jgi:hypothetical protein